MKTIKIIVPTILYAGMLLPCMAQSSLVDSIQDRFKDQLMLFPQEKLYLHTDKSAYIAGDTIWFRAHVVDAATHIPATVSRCVYVELINQSDSVIHRVRVCLSDSIYCGYMPIPISVPQSSYHLCAYTRFMENLNQDCLFDVELPVINPVITGNIYETLKIKDEQQDATASLFDLNHQNDILSVALSPVVLAKLSRGEKLYLAMHCRGIVFYAEALEKERERYLFDISTFPAGVVQTLLLDDRLHLLDQHLLCTNERKGPDIKFTTDKPTYSRREQVNVVMKLLDETGKPLKGNFSVSVTDDANVCLDSLRMIAPYLLWESDLSADRQQWPRYNLKNLLNGNYQHPGGRFDVSPEIKGIAYDFYSRKAKTDAEVSIFGIESLFSAKQHTDSLGRFCFTGFDFPEGSTFLIRATGKRGNKSIQPIVEPEVFYPFKHSVVNHNANSTKSYAYRNENQERFDSLAQAMNSYQLDEVIVKADSVKKIGKSVYHSFMGRVKTAEELMTPHPRSLTDMLERFPGVYISGDSVMLSGIKNELFFLDDIPTTFEDVRNINIDEIDEIEVIKDASAAVFGMKGANGAILIMTKRGRNNTPRTCEERSTCIPFGVSAVKTFLSGLL
ncbi:TonB-dependent receptor plug domain-containing protein [Bacteroides thetaiotaomicron]|uniref:TonB-dependent receptor n=1 Tax=Bacteroides thetaiotaomicron TaxID=818 RepID=UPI0021669FAC|nr:TonB-dependent receptor plug domain-containing protein [Bacteroides thetaiotaomicron]MCS3306052.1 TonB-dependent receptor plug domain-containing protein [Bacteroides thetaiotaomicron]